MKKYLILLIVPLLFFSTGCEEDDLEEITNTIIDENLVGVWKLLDSDYYYDYYRSFSSNGQWGYWRDDLEATEYDPVTGEWLWVSFSNYTNEQTGDYWVEDNIILLNYYDFSSDQIFSYSVSGNLLTLNQDVWEKQ